MAASAWHTYKRFSYVLANKQLDMNGDTFKVALFGSGTNANDSALDYSNGIYPCTNELSGGTYVTGGVSAGVGSWTGVGGVITFDVASVVFNANGGALSPYVAVIYDNTDVGETGVNKSLIAWCYLDATPAVYTIPLGQSLTIAITNVFTLS